MDTADTLEAMSNKAIKTIPVHARIPAVDVAKIDSAAKEELVSRSNMLARIVRQWAKRWKKP